jgi:hypothetical protein
MKQVSKLLIGIGAFGASIFIIPLLIIAIKHQITGLIVLWSMMLGGLIASTLNLLLKDKKKE